jgi:hypothetical protein
MCGGTIEVTDGSAIAECEYCGTQQVVPPDIENNEVQQVIEDNNKKWKRKKIIIAILAVASIIVLYAILRLTHVICFHSYSDATALEPPTCYYCDKTIGEPKPLTEITFPREGLAALLPTPKSNMGDIDRDSATYIDIYIGDMSLNDFNDYVNECSSMGFNVDYQRNNRNSFGYEYYDAEDIIGNFLTLKYYEDVKIMEIRMYAP